MSNQGLQLLAELEQAGAITETSLVLHRITEISGASPVGDSIIIPNDPYWRSRVSIGDPDECWPWNGGRSGKGYGNAKRTTASRWTWILLHGPIPDDLHVCHTCDNPPCCNPGHLFLGTVKDNVQDAMGKGRRPRVTDERSCPHGQVSPENRRPPGGNRAAWTYLLEARPQPRIGGANLPAGGRQCKKCRALYQRGLRILRSVEVACVDCGVKRYVDSYKPGKRCRSCNARWPGRLDKDKVAE